MSVMTTGTELMQQFVPSSPFCGHLGMHVGEMRDGYAEVHLPFGPELATFGEVVHGGAIATLADVCAMVTSWAGADVPEQLRGATVSLSVEYVAGAVGTDLVAKGSLIRRGANLCFVDIDVFAGDKQVAKAIATYKVG